LPASSASTAAPMLITPMETPATANDPEFGNPQL
jgi:hypothetical protein